MTTEEIKSLIRDLLLAAREEVDASKAAIVLFNQLADKTLEVLDAGDIDAVRQLIIELKDSSAALIAATVQNTTVSEHVTTEAIQAIADTMPDTANAPADGSTIL